MLKIDSTFCESVVSCGYPTSIVSLSVVENRFNVYPNPTISIINVESTVFGNEVQLQIVNSFGEIVYRCPLVQTQLSINISQLSDGIYYYQILKKGRLIENNKLVIIK